MCLCVAHFVRSWSCLWSENRKSACFQNGVEAGWQSAANCEGIAGLQFGVQSCLLLLAQRRLGERRRRCQKNGTGKGERRGEETGDACCTRAIPSPLQAWPGLVLTTHTQAHCQSSSTMPARSLFAIFIAQRTDENTHTDRMVRAPSPPIQALTTERLARWLARSFADWNAHAGGPSCVSRPAADRAWHKFTTQALSFHFCHLLG